jgi:hypothetical protein
MKSSKSSSSSLSWDDKYKQVKKQISDCLVEKRCKGENINKITINDITKSIDGLDKDSSSRIESETAKRKLLTDTLRKNLCLLSPPIASSSRSSFASNNSINPLQISRPSLNNNNNSSSNTNDKTSDRILIDRQKDIIRIQDDMLDDIDKGIGRIKEQALTINDEVKLQNKILTKLDHQVDDATEGLRQEARHAEQIRQKSQMCVLYIFVIIEVLIIAILLVVLYA